MDTCSRSSALAITAAADVITGANTRPKNIPYTITSASPRQKLASEIQANPGRSAVHARYIDCPNARSWTTHSRYAMAAFLAIAAPRTFPSRRLIEVIGVPFSAHVAVAVRVLVTVHI